MKNLSFFLFLVLSAFSAQAQVYVFKTYQDYANNSGEKYDTLLGYEYGSGIRLIVKSGEDQKRIACTKIYGFTVNGTLYRIYSKFGIPAKLCVQKGELYYYQGIVYNFDGINITITRKTAGGLYLTSTQSYHGTSIGGADVFSESLIGKMVELPEPMKNKNRYKNKIKKIAMNFPNYSKLFDCIAELPYSEWEFYSHPANACFYTYEQE